MVQIGEAPEGHHLLGGKWADIRRDISRLSLNFRWLQNVVNHDLVESRRVCPDIIFPPDLIYSSRRWKTYTFLT